MIECKKCSKKYLQTQVGKLKCPNCGDDSEIQKDLDYKNNQTIDDTSSFGINRKEYYNASTI